MMPEPILFTPEELEAVCQALNFQAEKNQVLNRPLIKRQVTSFRAKVKNLNVIQGLRAQVGGPIHGQSTARPQETHNNFNQQAGVQIDPRILLDR